MDLKELHDKLVSEGCNRFCIEGIGRQEFDDIERLEMNDGRWEVRYYERGQAGETLFSTADMDEAIKYYYNYVMSIQHRHLIAFSRSQSIVAKYKARLEAHGITTVEYTIPNYSAADDPVYGLVVINKDIFKARELFGTVPYIDDNLKR
ncbi:hypothetical protein HYN59_06055 [Flavobacterium album]|uniref:Uncharacterized protein n=1 Tax=Flavobacterium album TaxID=2175091 RepID=A0A2S1QWJ9_9FLAO|nr:hypothetical protein [Flavobacterium album]AWH84709.1 hypothetical protein HYN59_06055 [Flavobacterium album]